MLVCVSKLTTLISRPSKPPEAFISATAKFKTSYIGFPADSSPPDRSYMLPITIGSPAAAALRIIAGAKTLAAAVVFKNALRVLLMTLSSLMIHDSQQKACHGPRFGCRGTTREKRSVALSPEGKIVVASR